MKKILVLIFPVLVAAAALQFVSCKKAESKDGKLIYVGTGKNYEPYCYLDANGNLVGYEKAVLDEIDRRLPQYRFEYQVFDFTNLLISLASGKIDIAAQEIEPNPQRRETYLFGEEGYNNFDSYVAIDTTQRWAHFTSINDFIGNPDAVIGVSAGTNPEAFIKNFNETHDASHQLTYQVYGDDEEVYLAEIGKGRVTARLANLGDTQRANAVHGLNMILVGEPVILSDAYHLYRKDETELQQAVDGALREMKADGTLARIQKQEIADYYANLSK